MTEFACRDHVWVVRCRGATNAIRWPELHAQTWWKCARCGAPRYSVRPILASNGLGSSTNSRTRDSEVFRVTVFSEWLGQNDSVCRWAARRGPLVRLLYRHSNRFRDWYLGGIQ